MKTYIKDPNSVLDYKNDWSIWLGSDTITTSTWVIPPGVTKNSDTNDTTTTTIWLSGGSLDTNYEILNRIITAGGRTADRTFRIRMVDR